MRVLLTGASGYMGRPLAAALARRHEVIGTYLTEPEPIAGCRLVEMDLTDSASVRALVAELAPDAIIHAAADSKPEHCEKNPESARKINVEGTKALAGGPARFIYISTDLVFDGKKPPYREGDPPSPLNVYARSKVAAEEAVLPGALVMRLSLCYGWKAVGAPFFTDWLYQSLKAGEKVKLFTDQRRTFLLLDDAVEMIAEVLERPDLSGRLHMAGPAPLSRFEFGRTMCEVFGFDSSLVEPAVMADLGGTTRPGDCSLDGSRLNALLGLSPCPVREGLARLKASRS